MRIGNPEFFEKPCTREFGTNLLPLVWRTDFYGVRRGFEWTPPADGNIDLLEIVTEQ